MGRGEGGRSEDRRGERGKGRRNGIVETRGKGEEEGQNVDHPFSHTFFRAAALNLNSSSLSL